MPLLAVPVLLQLAASCPAQGVPDARMVATMRVESGGNIGALHDNTSGRSYFPDSIADAVALAKTLLAAGHSLDAGTMQVNSGNWARLGLTVETAFDPARNVCAGKQVLAEAISRATSCIYNTGRPDCHNRYPDRIEAAMADPGSEEVAVVPLGARVRRIIARTQQPVAVADVPAALPVVVEDGLHGSAIIGTGTVFEDGLHPSQ